MVIDSAQTSQDGTSSDSDLDNMKNLASKIEDENMKTQSLLKEIQDAMDAMKSQGQEGGRGARWVAIMEVVEVEEIAMVSEALTRLQNGRGGFRGRGRGRGSYNNNVGNQGNQTTGTQNQNQSTRNGNAYQPTGQNNQRRRDPFCFHCERNGTDFIHWPFQCTWLNQILSDQNATGHQNQSKNLNS